MAVLIDIIGAAIIVGIILLAILGLNSNLNQASYNKNFSLITQTNTVTLARVIEYDLVKIGFHTPKPAILAATSESISFIADLRNDGTVHTVTYSISPASVLGTTRNPRDRMVYRVEDGTTIAANLGLTSLDFSYYDKYGNVAISLDSIKSINVKFSVESPEPVDTGYIASFWQKRIYPRNL